MLGPKFTLAACALAGAMLGLAWLVWLVQPAASALVSSYDKDFMGTKEINPTFSNGAKVRCPSTALACAVVTWGAHTTQPATVSHPAVDAGVVSIASNGAAFAALHEDGSVSPWGHPDPARLLSSCLSLWWAWASCIRHCGLPDRRKLIRAGGALDDNCNGQGAKHIRHRGVFGQ